MTQASILAEPGQLSIEKPNKQRSALSDYVKIFGVISLIGLLGIPCLKRLQLAGRQPSATPGTGRMATTPQIRSRH